MHTKHTHTHTHTHVCLPAPETDHSIRCQTMSIFSGCCAIFLRGSPSLALPLLTSLTCHDQMGAFRVQQLTWTPGGGHSITSPFVRLAFFYHFIPPSPLHHLTSFSPSTNPTISLPLGTDSFRIIHLYVNNPPTALSFSPTHPPAIHKVR